MWIYDKGFLFLVVGEIGWINNIPYSQNIRSDVLCILSDRLDAGVGVVSLGGVILPPVAVLDDRSLAVVSLACAPGVDVLALLGYVDLPGTLCVDPRGVGIDRIYLRLDILRGGGPIGSHRPSLQLDAGNRGLGPLVIRRMVGTSEYI